MSRPRHETAASGSVTCFARVCRTGAPAHTLTCRIGFRYRYLVDAEADEVDVRTAIHPSMMVLGLDVGGCGG